MPPAAAAGLAALGLRHPQPVNGYQAQETAASIQPLIHEWPIAQDDAQSAG